MENQEAYRRAKHRVAARMSFYIHLSVYVVANLFLILINLATSPQYLWFKWPLAGWGVGLFFHALGVFFFIEVSSRGMVEKMIEKEVKKELAKISDSEKT